MKITNKKLNLRLQQRSNDRNEKKKIFFEQINNDNSASFILSKREQKLQSKFKKNYMLYLNLYTGYHFRLIRKLPC